MWSIFYGLWTSSSSSSSDNSSMKHKKRASEADVAAGVYPNRPSRPSVSFEKEPLLSDETEGSLIPVEQHRDLKPEPSGSFSDISVRDLTSNNRLDPKPHNFLHTSWYTLIAVVAFLDFLAKVVADYIRDETDKEEQEDVTRSMWKRLGVVYKRPEPEVLKEADPLIVDFIHFLDRYSIAISALFSILWFVDAFVKARRRRDREVDESDRRNVLQHRKPDEELRDLMGAWGAYYRTLTLHTVLLPISFYIVGYHLLTFHWSAASEILLDKDEEIQIGFRNEDGDLDEIHTFKAHLSKSTFFVGAQYIGTMFVRLTGMHIRKNIKRKVRRVTKGLAFGALRNPRRVIRKCRRALRALRWVKYLTPLVATSNKLRGNTMDLIKKYRQRLQAGKAERARRLIWFNQLACLPPTERKERAVIILQRVWRRRQAEKAMRALLLIQGNRQQIAAQRMQHIFRQGLKRARERIVKKREELSELTGRQEAMKRQRETLSVAERRRMYELQDELGAEATKLLNQKMLLRPNTRFAVFWKILFVVCVLFEISQLALAPSLSKRIDKKSKQPLKIQNILEYHLIPSPTSEWPACGFDEHDSGDDHDSSDLIPGMKLASGIKHLKSHAPLRPEDMPWFCNKPFASALSMYILAAKLCIYEFLIIVGIVCFVDVFVTFFTGEIDVENGNLIPKPFITRWIIPGIVLQLLVNPQMETVSKFAGKMLDYAHHVGPIRVYRWAAAFFYPMISVLVHWLVHDIWRPLVKTNNANTLKDDPFSSANPKPDKMMIDEIKENQRLRRHSSMRSFRGF